MPNEVLNLLPDLESDLVLLIRPKSFNLTKFKFIFQSFFDNYAHAF